MKLTRDSRDFPHPALRATFSRGEKDPNITMTHSPNDPPKRYQLSTILPDLPASAVSNACWKSLTA